jgi:hypothetical protein
MNRGRIGTPMLTGKCWWASVSIRLRLRSRTVAEMWLVPITPVVPHRGNDCNDRASRSVLPD